MINVNETKMVSFMSKVFADFDTAQNMNRCTEASMSRRESSSSRSR